MEEKIKQQSIDRLNVKENAIKILIEHNIKTIEQLCRKSKTDLKKMDLLPNDINKISIELQLIGLNLRNGL